MNDKLNFEEIAKNIKSWAKDFGFNDVGISDVKLAKNKLSYKKWISSGYHGHMGYLDRHQEQKFDPSKLLPNTQSVISVRLDYLPLEAKALEALKNKNIAYISRYALGRD